MLLSQGRGRGIYDQKYYQVAVFMGYSWPYNTENIILEKYDGTSK
ncbi:Uncharacterized [Moorella glycerini]|uniref:Uncharacterized protein n=1 Tax=Neomoorella stamsii TaxID=1266720 RepID=A0A9X7P6X2_9FIRM|nr:hypothetical protein MOST_09590 [Moorella stamsii]CEP65966.1 Uncharacterized [Moorella glycerini]